MKMLTGFLSPSRGQAFIAGYNVAENRLEASQHLGYLPENGPLYVEMTPESLLKYMGEVRGLSGEQLQGRLAWVSENARSPKSGGSPSRSCPEVFGSGSAWHTPCSMTPMC
jgi:ABC-2 type transport system ATP-binding protein